jgi:hypothetical protein
MCFSGKSPEKRARTWWIRTFKDHIFIGESKESLMGDKVSHYVDMIYWKDVTDNLFFKFQIPLLKSQPSEVKRIELVVDGKIWQPELLENIERIAVSTFELKKDLIYFKTIIRTVSKGLLAKKGKDRIEENVQSELFSSLLNLSADLALSASEQADLRISRYFPKLAHIEEIHLPAGTHTLQVNYYDKYGKRIYSDNHGTIELKPNQLNLVESFCLK